MKKIYLNTLKMEEIIKRLKDGEVVHTDGEDVNTYKMIDGILFSFCNSEYKILGACFNIANEYYYFEEPEEFKITETGVYKTKDGRRAFICQVKEHAVFGVIEGTFALIRWNPDGTTYTEDFISEKSYIVSRVDSAIGD